LHFIVRGRRVTDLRQRQYLRGKKGEEVSVFERGYYGRELTHRKRRKGKKHERKAPLSAGFAVMSRERGIGGTAKNQRKSSP